jgi:hypothetical protein
MRSGSPVVSIRSCPQLQTCVASDHARSYGGNNLVAESLALPEGTRASCSTPTSPFALDRPASALLTGSCNRDSMTNQQVTEVRVTHHTSVPGKSVEDLYNDTAIQSSWGARSTGECAHCLDPRLPNADPVTLVCKSDQHMSNRGTNVPSWHGACSYNIVKGGIRSATKRRTIRKRGS